MILQFRIPAFRDFFYRLELRETSFFLKNLTITSDLEKLRFYFSKNDHNKVTSTMIIVRKRKTNLFNNIYSVKIVKILTNIIFVSSIN